MKREGMNPEGFSTDRKSHAHPALSAILKACPSYNKPHVFQKSKNDLKRQRFSLHLLRSERRLIPSPSPCRFGKARELANE
jgi:hypothetical protein